MWPFFHISFEDLKIANLEETLLGNLVALKCHSKVQDFVKRY